MADIEDLNLTIGFGRPCTEPLADSVDGKLGHYISHAWLLIIARVPRPSVPVHGREWERVAGEDRAIVAADE